MSLPDLSIEQQFSGAVAGVDEAGRGALAGPVVAAAVIIDPHNLAAGVNDSKKLSKLRREKLYSEITANHCWAVGIISPEIIDQVNILEATKLACIQAANKLAISPDKIVVDGNMKFADHRFISLIKGDSISYSVAAASIIAKVTRDRIMASLATEHPNYKWDRNSGYGTKEHIESIWRFGYSIYHRRSFKVNSALA